MQLLLTCEHGGNRIPARYRALFADHAALLASHRGYDEGALQLAREAAKQTGAPLFFSTTSRLLIDLNRSAGNRKLYSEITSAAPPATRTTIFDEHYLPYRSDAEAAIARYCAIGTRVAHVSCHTFSPTVDGEVRDADIGLLYDPSRRAEKIFCQYWRTALRAQRPDMKVRFNYPYAGKSDGFVSHMRRCYGEPLYLGFELEVNQRHVADKTKWRALCRTLATTLRDLLAE